MALSRLRYNSLHIAGFFPSFQKWRRHLEHPIVVDAADVKVMPVAFPHQDGSLLGCGRGIELAHANRALVAFEVLRIRESALRNFLEGMVAIV
jgi:hypothetical protein